MDNKKSITVTDANEEPVVPTAPIVESESDHTPPHDMVQDNQESSDPPVEIIETPMTPSESSDIESSTSSDLESTDDQATNNESESAQKASDESEPTTEPEEQVEVVETPTAQEPIADEPRVEEPPVDESGDVEPAPMESSESPHGEQEDVNAPPADAEPTSDMPAESTDQDTGAKLVTPAIGSSISSHSVAAPKKTRKGMIIAVAVGLAVILSAAAVLLFLKSKNGTKADTTSKTTQTTTPAKTTVTAADVDTGAKAIDTTVGGMDNAKDFSADTLSDKTLSLQ
jgi:hypothetical protein